ncbi:MAG: tetratricopeptide repeat protein [Flavobacteriaceae bacterium]|jgi:tetratricopeptide (TPR) repeat protein|nr:tetratricopeptide repeat protein [Flavobacteriaceae bacterium]MDG1384992.1 tetratricopeptide repeat protein [Flavobacteriaceae bacterium]
MEFSQSDENEEVTLSKFESMLKTNNVFFFDSNEFENIIHHYLERGKIALAKKAIKLGLSQHPASLNLKLFKIETLIFENKLNEADRLLSPLFEIEPNNEELYIQKANIYSKKDQHEKAIEVFKKAIEIAEDSADLYSLIGMEYLFLDNYQEAKQNFIKCIELDLEDYSALYNIIYCFDFLDETTEAIEFLNEYLDKNPYSEVAWHQLGRQYVETKQSEKALAAFDFAIISDDTFVGAYLEKAKVLEKLNRYEEAIENYKITIAIEDSTAYAFIKIGYCYERLNAPDLALQHYYQAVEEDPASDKGWMRITKFFISKKDYQKALFYINKAIDIDADSAPYWLLYSTINERLALLEEAERGYKKTLELGDYELSTWLSRGDILIKLGEYEAAKFNFVQALEFYPKSEELEFRLSGVCLKLNNTDAGYAHLLTGLHINIDHVFILEELFPKVYQQKAVLQLIENFKNSYK